MSATARWGYALSILAFLVLAILPGTRQTFLGEVSETAPALASGAPGPQPKGQRPAELPLRNGSWAFRYVPFLRPVDWGSLKVEEGPSSWNLEVARSLLAPDPEGALRHAVQAVDASRGNAVSLAALLEAQLRAMGLTELGALKPGQVTELQETAAGGSAVAPENAFFDLFTIASLLARQRDAEALRALATASRKSFDSYSAELAGTMVELARSKGAAPLQAELAARQQIAQRAYPRLARQVAVRLSRVIAGLPDPRQRSEARLALLSLAQKMREQETAGLVAAGSGAEQVAGLLEDAPPGWNLGRFLSELRQSGLQARGRAVEQQIAEATYHRYLVTSAPQTTPAWQVPLLRAAALWYRLAGVAAAILVLLVLVLLTLLASLAMRGSPAGFGRAAALVSVVTALGWLILLVVMPADAVGLAALPITRQQFLILALLPPVAALVAAVLIAAGLSRRADRTAGYGGLLAGLLRDIAPWTLFAALVVFLALSVRLDRARAAGQAEVAKLLETGEVQYLRSAQPPAH